MDVTLFGRVTVPLHFLIDFPWDYPQSAPNIGFSFEFHYQGGSQYVMPDGRLKGKKVICLDILGNFSGVHTEWKQTVGSGWSPAYTVTTLLVQLQSVLCDLGAQMPQSERDLTYQSAVRFCENNPSAVLELLDEDEVKDRREKRIAAAQLAKVCGGNEELTERVQQFADASGFSKDSAKLKAFLALLSEVASAARGSACSSLEGRELKAAEVDTNIRCFATGKLYTEAMLGVGVSRERQNLTTAGEMLSKEAFDGGLRMNTNKSPFEFFLPVWINHAHAAGCPAWKLALQASCLEISGFEVQDFDNAILDIFPRLINQMIVEMMKPDSSRSEAIATFEVMCNFWRTLRWLVDSRPSLRARMGVQLSGFVSDEKLRHKDKSPDLGMVLVLFTAFQGHTGCPPREAFINSYLDENSLRWVMWWQRSRTPAEAHPVFEATKVSREICMFQMMVVDIVISDVSETLTIMDTTNCKLPERLETLQAEWRKRKLATTSWALYFQHIGASRPNYSSTNEWIADCVRRASLNGSKYGGPKGEGKGNGGGTGHGRGGRSGGNGKWKAS